MWLAYILIALEHEEREKQTGLWREVLTQLKNQKGKVNVDAAIKVMVTFKNSFIFDTVSDNLLSNNR